MAEAHAFTLLRKMSSSRRSGPYRLRNVGREIYAGGHSKEVQTGQSIEAARVYRVQSGIYLQPPICMERLFRRGELEVPKDVRVERVPCFEVDSLRLDAHYLLYISCNQQAGVKRLG